MSRSTADSTPSVTLPTPEERRRLREALALSEEQVAEAMGVTKATVKAWEAGRSAPRGRKREAYARLLGACGPEGPQPSPDPAGRAEAVSGSALTPSAPSSPVSSRPPATPAGDGVSMPAERLKPEAPEPGAPETPEKPQAVEKPEAAEKSEVVGPAAPTEPAAPVEAPAGSGGLTPEEAFDALYAHAAPGLVHQTYLLTGRRALSREAVERAFQQAWQRWPEVAVDADPVGWVRATAYEYALSPWHRLRRAHKHPDAAPAEAGRRGQELLSALLELPPPYRRTVLLYDGLGLDLPDTAAETEASTPAAANRLLHARTVLGRKDPELAEPEELHRRLNALAAEEPAAALPAARAVRTGSEHRTRTWTRAVVGVTAVLIAMTGFTAVTAPTRYVPVNAPGETVNGVPVRGGPEKLRPEDVELRDRLRSEPNPGPERLLPVAG
ncbi:sigma factor-like helix-turn-helix DNA-binding protein [Streptomyces sp. NPDC086147]|uniref:sigma factor-like helix-turn-helix DNA-binding protein n=1 Tax=Streptomyces sp. NPDC086147 TaxID=3155295 RepID=UPI00344D57B9